MTKCCELPRLVMDLAFLFVCIGIVHVYFPRV